MATVAARGSGTPTTTGTTWATVTNAVDGAAGTNPATYTTLTSTTSGAVATIEVTGYGFSTTVGAADTLNSVTVSLRHFENNTGRFASVTFQAFDGATAIGTATTCTLATAARNDTATPAVTLAQLRSSTFKIRVTITGAASTQSRVESIDYVDVTADYTPLPPTITQAAYRFYADGTETGAVAASYPETERTGSTSLGVTGGTIGVAQSFQGNGETLSRADFWLKKTGAPVGTITVSLYAHTGTFGSTGKPTGSALTTATTTLAAASLTTSYAWYSFTFDGSYTLVNGTLYCIAIEGSGFGDAANRVDIGTDTASPTHAGVLADTSGAAVWNARLTDAIFAVHTGGGALASQDTGYTADTSAGDVNLQLRVRLQSTNAAPPVSTDDFQLQWEKNTSGTWNNVASAGTVDAYASANLTDGAATTNRLGAGSGSFVAGKISEDGLVDNLGWTASNYTELLYSVTLKQADLAPTDTLRFRVLRNGATTGLTYTQTPTVTIGTAGPTDVTGTASGSITVGGTSSGQKDVTATATGSLTLTGTGAGAPGAAGTAVTGTATGSLTVTSATVGIRDTPGTATGAVTLTGAAGGQKTVTATAAGALSVTGTSAGVRPMSGVGVATITLAGTSTGRRGTPGTATGSVTISSSSVGTVTVTATASGALTVTGGGSGLHVVAATATGALTLTGTASAQKTVGGTGSSTITVSGTGSGVKTVTATAAGQVTFASTALGLVEGNAVGTATGPLTISGVATGVRGRPGVATGAVALSGTASGVRGTPATAVGALTVTGVATGTKSVTATATATITITSLATGTGSGVTTTIIGEWNDLEVTGLQWGELAVVDWFMLVPTAVAGTGSGSLSFTVNASRAWLAATVAIPPP